MRVNLSVPRACVLGSLAEYIVAEVNHTRMLAQQQSNGPPRGMNGMADWLCVLAAQSNSASSIAQAGEIRKCILRGESTESLLIVSGEAGTAGAGYAEARPLAKAMEMHVAPKEQAASAPVPGEAMGPEVVVRFTRLAQRWQLGFSYD